MNEQIKKFIESIKSFWKKQSKKRRIILLSSIAGVLIVSFVIVALMNRPKLVVLYPSLDKDEAVEVSKELTDRKVEFKEENGTILVPQEQEASLRMDLSNAGHPRTSPNYDFFIDNVDMMTTAEERKIIEKYQLDQKLAAVIEQIDGIKDATVTITLPDTDGYVLSSSVKEGASAGVTVTMTSSDRELSAKQVSGIKRLVASSVPSLKEEDVIIVDTISGNELSANSGGVTSLDMSKLKFIVESQFESDITKNIMKVMDPLFGENNVKVAVKSVIDIDKKIQEIVTYNPSEDNKGVVSGEQTSNEQHVEGGTGGIPGTDSNTGENITYPGVTSDGNTIYVKDEASYEYLVSSVKEQVQKDSGELKDLTISVALNTESIPETKRAELSKLIANAAAVNPEKVVIYTDVFSDSSNDKDKPTSSDSIFDEKPWLLYAIIGVVVLLITIIVFVVVLKKKKKKKEAEAEGFEWQGDGTANNFDDTSAFTFDPGEFDEIREIKEAKGQAMKKEIQDFSNKNPEIAAQLIKTLLKGDERHD